MLVQVDLIFDAAEFVNFRCRIRMVMATMCLRNDLRNFSALSVSV